MMIVPGHSLLLPMPFQIKLLFKAMSKGVLHGQFGQTDGQGGTLSELTGACSCLRC